MNSVEFNRIEGYRKRRDNEEIVASFDTRQHGILQLAYNSDGHTELTNEPDLMMFTPSEQMYIKQICAICWKIVFDGKKPDFDSMK